MPSLNVSFALQNCSAAFLVGLFSNQNKSGGLPGWSFGFVGLIPIKSVYCSCHYKEHQSGLVA